MIKIKLATPYFFWGGGGGGGGGGVWASDYLAKGWSANTVLLMRIALSYTWMPRTR